MVLSTLSTASAVSPSVASVAVSPAASVAPLSLAERLASAVDALHLCQERVAVGNHNTIFQAVKDKASAEAVVNGLIAECLAAGEANSHDASYVPPVSPAPIRTCASVSPSPVVRSAVVDCDAPAVANKMPVKYRSRIESFFKTRRKWFMLAGDGNGRHDKNGCLDWMHGADIPLPLRSAVIRAADYYEQKRRVKAACANIKKDFATGQELPRWRDTNPPRKEGYGTPVKWVNNEALALAEFDRLDAQIATLINDAVAGKIKTRKRLGDAGGSV